jgi:flavoprotein
MALTTGNHDQAACERYQQAERDRLSIRAKYRHKCEVCAKVCPLGEQPLEVVVRDKDIEGIRGQQRSAGDATKPRS